jgi:amino-acid N-acetyltransferase
VIGEIVIGPAMPEDLTGIQTLLAQAGLPSDLAGHTGGFLVARNRDSIVGCVGMEVAGPDALFRSLAVEPAYRGAGLGRRLYEALATAAVARGVERAYLLTTSIAPLAERWGFHRIGRGDVPDAIRGASQFRSTCCASAVAMVQDLAAAVKIGCT